jgi:hypothetical protein
VARLSDVRVRGHTRKNERPPLEPRAVQQRVWYDRLMNWLAASDAASKENVLQGPEA